MSVYRVEVSEDGGGGHPSRCWYLSTKLCEVTSQNAAVFKSSPPGKLTCHFVNL